MVGSQSMVGHWQVREVCSGPAHVATAAAAGIGCGHWVVPVVILLHLEGHIVLRIWPLRSATADYRVAGKLLAVLLQYIIGSGRVGGSRLW